MPSATASSINETTLQGQNQSNQPVDADLFKAIVEQAPDAVIFADLAGAIRVWNAGAQAVFGFSPAEAIGKSLDLIIPERFRQAHWNAFEKAIANGHTRLGNHVRTTRSIHKDGRKLYVDLSFGLVNGASGTVVGAIAVGRDCTTRYQEERALRDKVAAIERPAADSAPETVG